MIVGATMPKTLGEWVGLVGGLIGILGAGFAVFAFVLQYFATNEQLRVVDCQYFYRTEIIEAQAARKFYIDVFPSLREAVAKAQIAYNDDVSNPEKLASYKAAVEKQDEALDIIKQATTAEKDARTEMKKCGHRGSSNFSR